jgi:hypothetical protein
MELFSGAKTFLEGQNMVNMIKKSTKTKKQEKETYKKAKLEKWRKLF